MAAVRLTTYDPQYASAFAELNYEWIETNEGRLIDAKGVKGRYVRLYSNGNTSNDMNHYIEIEVYGRPAG